MSKDTKKIHIRVGQKRKKKDKRTRHKVPPKNSEMESANSQRSFGNDKLQSIQISLTTSMHKLIVNATA